MTETQARYEVFDQPQEAIRMPAGYLVDPDTGEVISDRDVGIDELVRDLKDGQEQEKSWQQHNTILKLAVGKKLDEANVKSAETPHGVIGWTVQQRRSAKAENIAAIVAEFGLDRDYVEAIFLCARDLDPKKLDGLIKNTSNDHYVRAVQALIEERTVSFVQLRPLRKAGPKLEREAVDQEAF